MMSSTKFLASLPSVATKEDPIDWSDHAVLLTLLGHRVNAVLHDLARRAGSEPWLALNMDCVRLTRAFVDQYAASLFCAHIARLETEAEASSGSSSRRRRRGTPSDTIAVLKRLARVFLLDALRSGLADLAEFSLLRAKEMTNLRTQFRDALDALDHELVGLTDAFAFSDWELNSVLGRADGDVYRSLWRTVNERNPVNTSRRNGVVSAFERLIRPLHDTATGKVKSVL